MDHGYHGTPLSAIPGCTRWMIGSITVHLYDAACVFLKGFPLCTLQLRSTSSAAQSQGESGRALWLGGPGSQTAQPHCLLETSPTKHEAKKAPNTWA